MILTNIGLWFFLLWSFNVFDPSAVVYLQLAGKLKSLAVSLTVMADFWFDVNKAKEIGILGVIEFWLGRKQTL
jgi:hypothetical protein